MEALPVDILEKVVLKIENPTDLAKFSLVSKFWYKHVRSNSFWEKMQPASSYPLCCYLGKNQLFWFRPFLRSTEDEAIKSKLSKPWETKLEVSLDCKHVHHHSSSGDLLSLCLYYHNVYEIHIYDQLKLDAPRDILRPINALVTGEKIGSLCIKADSSSGNYSLIIALYKNSSEVFSMMFYDSRTGGWNRSNSFDGSYLLCCGERRPRLDMCSVGNSVYFLETIWEGFFRGYHIVTYHIPTQTWTKTPFETRDVLSSEECFSDLSLTESKGKLMLVGLTIEHIYVWYVDTLEGYGRDVLRLSSKKALTGYYTNLSVKHGHGLLCIRIQTPKKPTRKKKILIYSPSTKRWQHAGVSSRKPGCCFLTKTDSIFAATRKRRRIS